MKKISIIFAAIVLLAVSCGKQANNNQTQNQQPTQAATTTDEVVTPKGQTQTRDNAGGPDYQPGKTISVSQSVQGSNINKPSNIVTLGQNAMDLLKATHTVTTKNYSGVGEFVESIDGIKPDAKHFWSLYVNGKSSDVGASSYIIQDGDKIEWKMEAIK